MMTLDATALTAYSGFASRALHYAAAMAEAKSDTADDTPHIVEVVIDGVTIVIAVAASAIHQPRETTPGNAAIGPGRAISAGRGHRRVFQVVSPLLHRYLAAAVGGSAPIALEESRAGRDPALQRLARTLVGANAASEGLDAIYADAVLHAIVTRVLYLRSSYDPAGTTRKTSPLPKWRLRRVAEYVATHLGDGITLADMAKAAGLSRMHFAAQFRTATGIRPHDYVLQRRIDRARDLLLTSRESLVDVALGVGFQTQAHFTTVFKRIVGQTPDRWRRANLRDDRSIRSAA